jgi:hypothetical protein
MKRIMMAAALLGLASLPAMAQSSGDMTCAQFNGMKSSGRMAAVESMQGSMASTNKMNANGAMAAGAMKGSDHMSAGAMTKKVASTCKKHPDEMMGDAMQGMMAH